MYQIQIGGPEAVAVVNDVKIMLPFCAGAFLPIRAEPSRKTIASLALDQH